MSRTREGETHGTKTERQDPRPRESQTRRREAVECAQRLGATREARRRAEEGQAAREAAGPQAAQGRSETRGPRAQGRTDVAQKRVGGAKAQGSLSSGWPSKGQPSSPCSCDFARTAASVRATDHSEPHS